MYPGMNNYSAGLTSQDFVRFPSTPVGSPVDPATSRSQGQPDPPGEPLNFFSQKEIHKSQNFSEEKKKKVSFDTIFI